MPSCQVAEWDRGLLPFPFYPINSTCALQDIHAKLSHSQERRNYRPLWPNRFWMLIFIWIFSSFVFFSFDFFMQLNANLYESISIILKGSAIIIFQILKKHQCFSDYSRKIRISTYILSDYYSLIQPKISFKSWVNLFNLFYTVITFLKKTSAIKQFFYFLCYVNNYKTNEHLHYFAIYISIRSSQPF